MAEDAQKSKLWCSFSGGLFRLDEGTFKHMPREGPWEGELEVIGFRPRTVIFKVVAEVNQSCILMDEGIPAHGLRAGPNLIRLQWKGHARSGQYRYGLERALAFVRGHDVRHWLADLPAA
ncbi:MAG: hypothetical protein R2810_04910 [Flavobacteriales bacterium]